MMDSVPWAAIIAFLFFLLGCFNLTQGVIWHALVDVTCGAFWVYVWAYGWP